MIEINRAYKGAMPDPAERKEAKQAKEHFVLPHSSKPMSQKDPAIYALAMKVLMPGLEVAEDRLPQYVAIGKIVAASLKSKPGNMLMSKDKKKDEAEAKEAIESLADAYLESVRDGYRSDLEPFEAYEQKVRSQIHRDADKFRERFQKGYHVLINEINKNKKT